MFCFPWTVAKKLFLIACISNPVVPKRRKGDNCVSGAVYSLSFLPFEVGLGGKDPYSQWDVSSCSQPGLPRSERSRRRHNWEWSSPRWKPKGHQGAAAIFDPGALIFFAVSSMKALFLTTINKHDTTLKKRSGNLGTKFGFSSVAPGGWLDWPGKWTPLGFCFSLWTSEVTLVLLGG